MTTFDQQQARRFDPRAFADAGNTRDAVAPGFHPVGGEHGQQLFGGCAVLRTVAFNKADGLGQGDPTATADGLCPALGLSQGALACASNSIKGPLACFILGVVGHAGPQVSGSLAP